MIQIAQGAQKGPAVTLDQPLEHLMACHRRIEQRLDTLERVVPFLAERREEALRAIQNALAFLDSSGVNHTEDEERSVFPRLEGRLLPDQAALILSLESDHQAANQLHADLKAVVGQLQTSAANDEKLQREYANTVTRLCALYRRHIQQEDTELIGMSRAVLTPAELAEISAEMKQRRGLAGS